MRNAKMIVVIAALAFGACNKQQPQANEQNMSLDAGMPNQVAGNAEIETLPPDESSTTPSNQLQNGFDSPDVNDVEPGNTQ